MRAAFLKHCDAICGFMILSLGSCGYGLFLFSSTVPGVHGYWKSADAPSWNPCRRRPPKGNNPGTLLLVLLHTREGLYQI